MCNLIRMIEDGRGGGGSQGRSGEACGLCAEWK